MFDLKVVGLDEANILIEENWPTRIVSLMESPGAGHGMHHLHIRVDDISRAAYGMIHPTPEHLLEVLAFTEDLTNDDRLLVHCFAGMSRSTAIAIGILIQHGMEHHEAFDHVEKIRNILLPNQLFIQFIDDHFGLHDELVKLVSVHRVEAFEKYYVQPFLPSQRSLDYIKSLFGR